MGFISGDIRREWTWDLESKGGSKTGCCNSLNWEKS